MILSVLFKIYTLTAENFIIQEIWKTIEMQVCIRCARSIRQNSNEKSLSAADNDSFFLTSLQLY